LHLSRSDEILRTLQAGTHVVMDRYAYSGVAFSSGAFPFCARAGR
jgi:thymidylate kinase